MSGGNYIAMVRLTTKGRDVLAMPGETCERVPESSLPFLLDHNPPQVLHVQDWDRCGQDVQAELLDRAGKNLPLNSVERCCLFAYGTLTPPPEPESASAAPQPDEQPIVPPADESLIELPESRPGFRVFGAPGDETGE